MQTKDAFDGDSERTAPMRVVDHYDYHDEAGRLLYQSVRLEAEGGIKTFKQRRPAPGILNPKNANDSHWVWNLGDERRVLYQLPKLIEHVRKDRENLVVWIAEGERKARWLASLGLAATTNVCGAKAPWIDEYSQALCGLHCCLLPDNDDVGRRHMMAVAGSLIWHRAKSVTFLDFPNLAEKDDVMDWRACRILAGAKESSLKDELIALFRSKEHIVRVKGK